MPAVAKLMRMKGPNGKLPCRACNIRGVRARTGPNPNTNYVPLSRPFDEDPNGPQRYQPLDLPLRTHAEYIDQAMDVEEAVNDADEDRWSRETGINGLLPLARIPSLSFPVSFPHDFMHLIFENIIPTLFDLWTRSQVWTAIAEACPLVGNSIPYVFGCRVPDPKKKRAELTAESRLLLATLLAPVLLYGRFVHPHYYRHFIRLVRLINLCIDFEIMHDNINEIRVGFAEWVTLTTKVREVLLFQRSYPVAMGPVWAYWAFPMERFCGALTRASMSRRHPYSSINRRVLQITQLSQIKLIYGLTEELDLEECKENIKNGTRYDHYPDLVFVNPTKEIDLQPSLQRKVAKHVSSMIGIEEWVISNALEGRRSRVWGKMQRLGSSLAEQAVGGDVVRGAMLTSCESMRDVSHVRFYSKFSRWHWDRVRPTELHDERLSYGRAEMFVVLEANFIASLNVPDPRPIVVAIVSPFVRLRYIHDADLVEYRLSSGNYAGAEVVDATKIDCLVGRITTGTLCQRFFVVERTSVVGRMDMLDITVEPD
ncbi:hypothetical protein RSAG8_08183, partial [Rhizoctonia solani AG-8 WAC10335]